jgi:diguanylate cyclase (GGDEF)-like protein
MQSQGTRPLGRPPGYRKDAGHSLLAAVARQALALLALALLLLPAAGRAAPAPLLLGEGTPVVELWPAVQMLPDPGKQLTLDDVLAAPERFAAPASTHATLGLRKDAVWLRVPLQAAGPAEARWVLDIDYPLLNRVDVVLLAGGRVLQQAQMGNLLPFAQRPLAGRSLAMELVLRPGVPHDLLLRVETTGAMILPLTLSRPAEFHTRAVREQMLQGLLAGVGLYLLLYSLAQWLMVREPLFIKYALLISGSITFSLLQFGVGAQYLWTDNFWIERHAAGLSALLATCGSFLFIEQVLAGPGASPRFSRFMKGGAVLAAVLAAAYALDLLTTAMVSAAVSVLGLVPALMGIPGALARARQRDPVGLTFLLAWAVYFFSTAIIIGVINGRAPVNFWTLHSFQFGAALDMLLFMRVLGLRTQAIHAAAQRATQERDVMRSLAHTDSLTGLPNRRGLHVQLTGALPRCGEQDVLALYLLDLDGFKPVNDQHGHDTGDELLVAVGRRLQACTRSRDVVARLGGDEFVVMTTGLHGEEQARALGQQLLESFRAPFQLAGHHCQVGLTVGYVLAPHDGRDAAELLKLADAAMYAGKQEGKGCVRRGGPAADQPLQKTVADRTVVQPSGF